MFPRVGFHPRRSHSGLADAPLPPTRKEIEKLVRRMTTERWPDSEGGVMGGSRVENYPRAMRRQIDGAARKKAIHHLSRLWHMISARRESFPGSPHCGTGLSQWDLSPA